MSRASHLPTTVLRSSFLVCAVLCSLLFCGGLLLPGNALASRGGPWVRLEENLRRHRLYALRKQLPRLRKELARRSLPASKRAALQALLHCASARVGELNWQVRLRLGPPLFSSPRDLKDLQRWYNKTLQKGSHLQQHHKRCLQVLQQGSGSFLQDAIKPQQEERRLRQLQRQLGQMGQMKRQIVHAQQALSKSRAQIATTRSKIARGEEYLQATQKLLRLKKEERSLRRKLQKTCIAVKRTWKVLPVMVNHLPELPPRPVHFRSYWPRIGTSIVSLSFLGVMGLILAITEGDIDPPLDQVMFGGAFGSLALLASIPAASTWETPTLGWLVGGAVAFGATALAGGLLAGLGKEGWIAAGWGMILVLPVHLVWNVGGWVLWTRQQQRHAIWNSYLSAR